jgi:cohesin complex subunit SA-1/2
VKYIFYDHNISVKALQCSRLVCIVAFQYYNDYGDIIKATLGKAREINKTNCARTMAISLTMLFRELQRDGTRINRQSEDFVSLKVRLLLFQIHYS